MKNNEYCLKTSPSGCRWEGVMGKH